MSLALVLLGTLLTVFGIAMIALPGPGIPIIAIGLGCVLAGVVLRRSRTRAV